MALLVGYLLVFLTLIFLLWLSGRQKEKKVVLEDNLIPEAKTRMAKQRELFQKDNIDIHNEEQVKLLVEQIEIEKGKRLTIKKLFSPVKSVIIFTVLPSMAAFFNMDSFRELVKRINLDHLLNIVYVVLMLIVMVLLLTILFTAAFILISSFIPNWYDNLEDDIRQLMIFYK